MSLFPLPSGQERAPAPGPCSNVKGRRGQAQLVTPASALASFPAQSPALLTGLAGAASGSVVARWCHCGQCWLRCHFLSSNRQTFPSVPLSEGPKSPGIGSVVSASSAHGTLGRAQRRGGMSCPVVSQCPGHHPSWVLLALQPGWGPASWQLSQETGF